MKLARIAKAIAAGVAGGLATLYTALVDGSVTPQEWVGVALGALGALGITYRIPNTPAQK